MDDDPGSLALSELEDMKVVDAAGAEVGELLDVVALCTPDTAVVTGFFIDRDDEQLRVPGSRSPRSTSTPSSCSLCCAAAELEPASLRSDELALVDSVLDNQVLDMRRRVFVRVQDVAPRSRATAISWSPASTPAAAPWRGASASASSRAACRGGAATSCPGQTSISSRCGSRGSTSSRRSPSSPSCTPPTSPTSSARSGPRERAAVLAALNPGLAADTLQEMDEELRTAALQEMPLERAAAVLEKIETDEAADILSELPDELAQELLARLPDEREEDLRELASHPEHTAGVAHDDRLRDAAGRVDRGRGAGVDPARAAGARTR